MGSVVDHRADPPVLLEDLPFGQAFLVQRGDCQSEDVSRVYRYLGKAESQPVVGDSKFINHEQAYVVDIVSGKQRYVPFDGVRVYPVEVEIHILRNVSV